MSAFFSFITCWIKGIIFLFIIFCSSIYDSFSSMSASDASLQRFFYQHEVEFNQLVHDLLKKQGEYCSTEKDRTDLEKKLSVKACKDNDGTVKLYASGTGMAFSTSTYRGYVYSVKPLQPVFDSLDNEPLAYERKMAYKKINSSWYLYYISFP